MILFCACGFSFIREADVIDCAGSEKISHIRVNVPVYRWCVLEVSYVRALHFNAVHLFVQLFIIGVNQKSLQLALAR